MPSVVPLVPLKLDRERHLRFDRKAVFAAEVELTRCWGTRTTFYAAMAGLMNAVADGNAWGMSLNDVAILVWQGLLHEDPTLTLEQTQDLLPYLDVAAMVPIFGALLEAWNIASQPAPGTSQSQEGPETADPLARSTGLPSGVSSAVNSASVTTSSGV